MCDAVLGMCRSATCEPANLRNILVRNQVMVRLTPIVIVTVLPETETARCGILSAVKRGKLQRQVDVANRMVSDLSLLSPTPSQLQGSEA